MIHNPPSLVAPVPERVERPKEAVMPLRVGVVYPLLLSAAWGAGTATLVVLLVLLLEELGVLPWRVPGKFYLLIWLIVFNVVMLRAWWYYVPSALWLVEQMFQVDLNGDRRIGPPPVEHHTYEVRIPDENRTVYVGDLAMPERELVTIARAVTNKTKNLSVNSLRHPDAARLLEQMIARGLAVRTHPKQPAELTRGGRAWFEELKEREG
jgi:hypothetical protein